MPRKPQSPTLDDAFRLIAGRLQGQALRPNIYAYKPHPKQEMFHARAAKYGLYIGGNRAGKTVAGICEDIWWLTGRHPYRETPPPPVRGRIVGVDFLQGIEKILKPELARWIPLSDLKGGSWETAYDKSTRTLTLENGSFVEFMSYDQDIDKFAGTSRHFIHFDEEPPEEIFEECRARLIDTGGSWWMTLTPVEGMQWIYDKIYLNGKEHPESNIAVIEVDMTENPYLAESEVQEYISGLDEDTRNARVHGKFVQRGGLVFKDFARDIHVVDYFVPPKDWLWIASLDHGFNNPTAWLWHAVGPDLQVVTFQEHYESKQVIEYHAKVVHNINRKLGRPPEQYIGDPSIRNTDPITGTSIQQEYTKYGVPITLGNNDVSAGIVRMAGYLKVDEKRQRPNWVITRNCTNLVYEMGRYRWKTWASKKVEGQNNLHEQPTKRDDHAVDSARYFFMSRPELTPDQPSGPPPIANHLQAPSASSPGNESSWDTWMNSDGATGSEWNTEYMDDVLGGVY